MTQHPIDYASSQHPIDYASLLNILVHLTEETRDNSELKPHVFHPSQLSNTCIRQAFLQKLNLVDLPRGPALVGTLIHEFIEENLPWLAEEHPETLRKVGIDPAHVEQLEFEQEMRVDLGGIVLKGRCDLFDPVDDLIVDWKTKTNLKYIDPPVEEDVEQLTLYMHMQGGSAGQLVYLQRTDMEAKPYPGRADTRHTVPYDEQRFKRLVARAWHIRQAIEKYGVPTTLEEIPFERCGCWKCEREDETLALPDQAPACMFSPRQGPPECVDESTLQKVRAQA